jgi:uncharacterized protein
MTDALSAAPPWYVAGPAFGLVVVAVLTATNQRLGVVGGYADILGRAAGRSGSLGWKGWFLVGIVGGGLLYAVASGTSRLGDGYGWLGRAFADEGDVFVAAVLLVAGALIGFGAKTAGGCTSGNGLAGCGLGSPASLVATMTFMAAAVGTAFATKLVVGF